MTLSNANTQRALIWLGVGMLAIFFIVLTFVMGFIPPPSPSLSADEVVLLYSQNNIQFRIGVAITMLMGAGYLPWSLAISAQLARHETGAPLWAILQGLTGALGSLFIWGPPLLWGVAAYYVERDPAITLLMHQFAWLTFITPLMLFTLQIIPIIVISFSDKNNQPTAFPRWFGYFTLFFVISGEVGVAPIIFNSGPFGWNAIPFYLPFGLFAIWVPTLMYTMLRAIKQQESLDSL